jgi:formamidopyrimidine-DNA glycosylase
MTQMWGAMELFEAGQELDRQYIKGMRTTPVDPGFTFQYFTKLLDELKAGQKRSAKGLLTQDQLLPGIGNGLAQDILFTAGLHPRHSLEKLDGKQQRALYDAILEIVKKATDQGGRFDEYDLFNHPGGYPKVMGNAMLGQPCPHCGQPVEKIQYLGGACYFCPACQV